MQHDLKKAPKLKPLAELEKFFSAKTWKEMFLEGNSEEEQEPNYPGVVYLKWKAPEFEVYEKSATWYAVALVILFLLVVYGIITNSPVMAITFILIGAVGYVQLGREPRLLTFAITTKGIFIGRELYPWDNVKSFWIFYDPPHHKSLSLHTTAGFYPHVQIPIQYENPVLIRENLLKFVPEKKQEQQLVDIVQRILHV